MKKYSGVAIESGRSDGGNYSKLLGKNRRSKNFFVRPESGFDLGEGYFEIEYEVQEIEKPNGKMKKVSVVTKVCKFDPNFEDYLSEDPNDEYF